MAISDPARAAVDAADAEVVARCELAAAVVRLLADDPAAVRLDRSGVLGFVRASLQQERDSRAAGIMLADQRSIRFADLVLIADAAGVPLESLR